MSAIPESPHLKPWYRVARQGETLVLEYAHRAVVFRGAAVARLVPPLLPLLDGTRTLDGIVAGVGRVDAVADLVEATAPFVVAAPAPGELPELAELNRRRLRAGTPWLPVLPFDGRLAMLGPLFLPGESCCYECYRLRRAANSPFADEFWLLERGRAAYPSSPALDAAAAGFAAHLVLRWLAARDRTLPGAMFALEHERVPALTAH